MQRIILAVLSDTHGGFTLGLMNPNVTLYDETHEGQLVPFTPEPTASQDYLWDLYLHHLDMVQELAGERPIIGIHNGDLTQGNRHRTALVSTRSADQIIIAAANLHPLLSLPTLSHMMVVAGTEAHNFGQGGSDILVGEMLKDKHPSKNIDVLYHGLADIGGVSVDYAHHGPYPGSREWLKGNVARYYLQSMMIHAIKHGHKPPDLVIRAHYHTPVIETVRINGYTSTIVVSPSMCMVDDYAHQAAKSPDDVTCGMLVYEIVNDKLLDIHEFTKTFDTRTEYFL